MKRIKRLLFVFICVFSILLVGCNNSVPTNKDTYTITYYVNGDEYSTSTVEDGQIIEFEKIDEVGGLVFYGWYTDSDYSNLFKGIRTNKDLKLYGYYETGKVRVKFETGCDTLIEDKVLDKGSILDGIPTLSKDGYIFDGWYRDSGYRNKFNIETDNVSLSLTLYAKWNELEPTKINLKYTYATDEYYANKEELYVEFYTYFYNFMKDYTSCNLETTSLEDFLVQGKTWTLNGRSDMYHFGDRYSRFYVSSQKDGTLEEQPETSFLGYCYKNGKFIDFIHHLEEFFAYWRTDEGYTGGSADPNNTGNDFYIEPWASLVDTAKFFFFTADTLQTKYAWFTSERVKHALDYIPNVLVGINNTEVIQGEEYIFKTNKAILNGEEVSVKYYLDKECSVEIFKLNETQTGCDECDYLEVFIKVIK